MPITVEWDDAAQTIVLLTYTGQWDWQDHNSAWEKLVAMAAAKEGTRLDILSDHLSSAGLPTGVLQVARRTRGLVPADAKLVITITDSAVIKSMYAIYLRIYPQDATRFLLTKSLDEARKIVRTDRDS